MQADEMTYSDEYDSPWKEALEHAFPEFMAFYRHGWNRQRILDIFAVLDWMMRLPKVLEQKLWCDIETIEGENRMRYVTSVERLAIERGMKKGMQQGIQQGMQQGKREGKLEGEITALERILIKRFGAVSPIRQTSCRFL